MEYLLSWTCIKILRVHIKIKLYVNTYRKLCFNVRDKDPYIYMVCEEHRMVFRRVGMKNGLGGDVVGPGSSETGGKTSTLHCPGVGSGTGMERDRRIGSGSHYVTRVWVCQTFVRPLLRHPGGN